jgi:hypothetical protein
MRIELAADIPKRFHTSLRQAGDREIGGLLFAEQLKPSHFCIVDFSLDLCSGSHAGFRRDPQAHQNALDEFSYALGEISNASTILVNGIPTLLFQFARARKI